MFDKKHLESKSSIFQVTLEVDPQDTLNILNWMKFSAFYAESIYGLIFFDERVTFWLQRIQSLRCACAYVALFARDAHV